MNKASRDDRCGSGRPHATLDAHAEDGDEIRPSGRADLGRHEDLSSLNVTLAFTVENTTVILYFGGNGEDVLRTATTSQKLDARKLLFVNYRGYGRSTGKPGQAALYEDASSIYDYAIGRGISPESIVVMGRSLGSAPASMLAGCRPVRAAILITPFDNTNGSDFVACDIGLPSCYWWLAFSEDIEIVACHYLAVVFLA